MTTLQENSVSTIKPWMHVAVIVMAAVIGIFAYIFGHSHGVDESRDNLSTEVRRIAKAKKADTTLVFGKKGGVNAVHIPSGNPIPSCDERKPDQEQCNFDVKREPDGKFILLDKRTQQPVSKKDIFADGYFAVHKGSYCTTSSSGGKTTTNCCHSPSCW